MQTTSCNYYYQQRYDAAVADIKSASTYNEKDPNIKESLRIALEKLKESLIHTKEDNSFYLGDAKKVKVTIKGRDRYDLKIDSLKY